VGCLTSNKPFSFGVDPDHVLDPGILAVFLPLCSRSDFEIFASNAINNDYAVHVEWWRFVLSDVVVVVVVVVIFWPTSTKPVCH